VRTYLIQRVLIAIPTLVGMSIIIFVLMRIAPGNIIDIIFQSAGYVDPAAEKQIMQELGLDQPMMVQYIRWVAELCKGNLGKSYRYDVPAWQIIKPRIPVTAELGLMAIMIAVFIGVPSGSLDQSRR